MEANEVRENLETLLRSNKWENYNETLRQAGIKEISDLSDSEPIYLISLGIPPLIAKSLINLSKRQNTHSSSNQSSNSNVNQLNAYQIPPDILDVLSIDIYSRLGLSPTSSEEEIKIKWKELMKKTHPDKNSHIDIKTSQEYNQYFKILRNPYLRKQYDTHYKPKVSFDNTTFSQDNSFEKLKKEISESYNRKEDILKWNREKNHNRSNKKKIERRTKKNRATIRTYRTRKKSIRTTFKTNKT
jgi:hypothetical protein